MNLSIENLIDIREAVQRRIVLLQEADPRRASPALEEKNRRLKSLNESLSVINDELKDLQFEAETNLTSYLNEKAD